MQKEGSSNVNVQKEKRSKGKMPEGEDFECGGESIVFNFHPHIHTLTSSIFTVSALYET